MDCKKPGRACTRCRERRVKCDRRSPYCLRCENFGAPCPGYERRRKFYDEGVHLRMKYGKSVNHKNEVTSSISSPVSRFNGETDYNPRNDGRGHWKHGPSGATTISDTISIASTGLGLQSSWLMDSDHTAQQTQTGINSDIHGISASQNGINGHMQSADIISAQSKPTDSAFDEDFFDLDPDAYYALHYDSCGYMPSVPPIVNNGKTSSAEHFSAEDYASLRLQNPSPGIFQSADLQITDTTPIAPDEREHEMAYLIRHFTEVIGPWMDLFDGGRYFGSFVPLKARQNALLKYALAAVASKQLGRMGGQKPISGGLNCRLATMESYENASEVDWFYKAANYYDKALSYMRIYMQALSCEGDSTASKSTSIPASSFLHESGTAETIGSSAISSSHSTGISTNLALKANTDDLLAAISVFSVYECLDQFKTEQAQHLSGFESLLIAEVCPLPSGELPEMKKPLPKFRRARNAAFWNFAREDYLAAYINCTRTRLNTEDLSMWRASGLQISDDGSLYTQSLQPQNDLDDRATMTEDLVSHTLVWILLKIMNFVAAEFGVGVGEQDSIGETSSTGLAPTSDTQTSLAQRRYTKWIMLQTLLDKWYECLPDTFYPCVKAKHSENKSKTVTACQSQFMELYFTIPMCAAAIQSYHFARILLLLNKPVQSHIGSNSQSSRFQAAREVQKETCYHSREICGIALARPHPAVRIQMLQPLYVAGLCFADSEDRTMVLELLRAIEADTGSSTGYRVRQLLSEWGWEQADPSQALSR